jgi:hypothetical protein
MPADEWTCGLRARTREKKRNGDTPSSGGIAADLPVAALGRSVGTLQIRLLQFVCYLDSSALEVRLPLERFN